MESISDRFTFEECLHILMISGPVNGTDATQGTWTKENGEIIDMAQVNRWSFDNFTTKNDLVRSIIMTIDSLNLDPRYYLTTEGPISPIVLESTDITLSIQNNIFSSREEIISACQSEGIETSTINSEKRKIEKPLSVLYNEFVLAQLSRTFLSNVGNNRTKMSALGYHHLASGEFIDDVSEDELVFYGKRDGTSLLNAYGIEELYYTFSKSSSIPYDPYSILIDGEKSLMLWYTFPSRSIRKLMFQILKKKIHSGWALPLQEECRKVLDRYQLEISMFHNDFIIDLRKGIIGNDDNLLDSTDLNIKLVDVLVSMFNTGQYLKDFDENLNEFEPEALNILRMRMVGEQIPDTLWTGRPQAEAKMLILDLQYKIKQLPNGYHKIFNKLHVLRYYEGVLDGSFDNSDFEMTYFLEILHQVCSYGLIDTIETCGHWLELTANVYHKMILGTWIKKTDNDLGEIIML